MIQISVQTADLKSGSDLMGLFNNTNDGNKILETKNRILNNRQVLCEIVIGTYGNDDIVAGAMIGETGKYIAMANYGNPKWGKSLIEFYEKGIRFSATGAEFFYDEITDIEILYEGIRHGEMIFHVSNGSFGCKMKNNEMHATVQIISELKEKYMQSLAEEQIEEDKNENKSNIDRLIHLGEMHEKGLISDEEFASMKQQLIDKSVCENCGAELTENSNFCSECGQPVK